MCLLTFQFVLTTSNPHPFTYHGGIIDISSGTGRSRAVTYTNYAIGKLIKEEKNKSGAEGIVSVFIANYESCSSGKEELSSENTVYRLLFVIQHILHLNSMTKPSVR